MQLAGVQRVPPTPPPFSIYTQILCSFLSVLSLKKKKNTYLLNCKKKGITSNDDELVPT